MSIKPLQDAVIVSMPFFLVTLLGIFLGENLHLSVPAVIGYLGGISALVLFLTVFILKQKMQEYALQQSALLSAMDKKDIEIVEVGNALSEERNKKSQLQDVIVSVSNLAGQSLHQSIAGLESVSERSDFMRSTMRELKNKAALYRSELSDASEKVIGAMRMADKMMEVNEKVNSALILIPKITAQINLVALNATIESSRAGEVGKGFAVVAAEVKKLARETFEVTQNITDFLSEGNSSALEANQLVASMVDVMHDAKRMIEDTIVTISEHDDNLEQMRGALSGLVNSIGDVNQEISSLKDKTL